MNVPPMVTAIMSLRSSLPPVSDELRTRVQSIRVRSLPDARVSSQPERSNWRHKQNGPSTHHREAVGGHWRHSTGSLSQTPASPFRFMNSAPPSPQSEYSPRPALSRPPSFVNTPAPDSSPVPMRYVSRFHNGSKAGDDQILNTIILNKLNVFSVKTYDDVKQFLFQILGSDQKEFIREFTWLVFRKAAAEEKFCGLFAKLLSEIKKEYPVILEEMRKLHTTYLDIWKITDSSDTTVDKRCRLGYSQFLAELTALGVLESDTMKQTLETLKASIVDCLRNPEHTETVEEYMDCLRQLCGSKVPKNIRHMIYDLLVNDFNSWIAEPRNLVPGLSTKSRFACMDLRDLLTKAL